MAGGLGVEADQNFETRCLVEVSKTGEGTSAVKLDLPSGAEKFVHAFLYPLVDGKPDFDRAQQVAVLADRVDIRDKVFFDLDSATITGVSYRVLDDVAAALENHPELRLVEVQGHTDDIGADDYNQDLSQRRAEAVRKYLIGQGVEHDRLVARGYGESKPLQEGTGEDARDVNRRVMFKVLAGPPRP